MADLPIEQAIELLDDEQLEHIRTRAARLVNRMLAEAERQIETATPEIRAQLVKSVLPSIMKELGGSDADTALDELKAQHFELMEGIRSALTTRLVDTTADTPRALPQDGPDA